MPSINKVGDVEAKYDVALNYPNLELHSAAASGNVGLVHYALTHGQPVNSVLHGVLPLHAACSGGNVSVVRMLIERGADVNAPRLPRRYSDGKKSNAPSIGAAGSTPLHFAAANGHAPIVQILLTCGAIPNKPDKNGMTPEALAEINGHTDVIRVLRVWEHLQVQEGNYSASYAGSDRAEPSSPSGSTSQLDDDRESRYGSIGQGSRKGKERAMSFASNVSETTSLQAAKVIKSFEGLLNRGSRSNSVVSTGRPDLPIIPRITTEFSDGSPHQTDTSSQIDLSSPISPSPLNTENLAQHDNTLGRVDSAASGTSSTALGLARAISEHSDPASINSPPPPPLSAGLGPAPTRHNPSTSGSSRRPSLPSILERAAHPGAAFRAALRREHGHVPPVKPLSPDSTSPSTLDPTSPQHSHNSHGHHGFFRGRIRSNEFAKSSSSQLQGQPHHRHHSHKYMSKHALVSLFRRSHSPPSRSPSPPKRETTKPIAPEELDEGIEKLRRASIDLDMRQNSEKGESVQPDEMKPTPASAPATKTMFYEEEITPLAGYIDPTTISLPPSSPGSSRPPSERRTRPRQASDVIAPSPLAHEWAHSSDSDSPSSVGIRRAKTEIIKSPSISPRPALQARRSNPPSPLRHPSSPQIRATPTATTPVGSPLRVSSSTQVVGLGWTEDIDLRKVASGVFRKDSLTKKDLDEMNGLDNEVEDDEFHDAENGDDEEEYEGSQGQTPTESQRMSREPTARLSDETERENEDGGDTTPEAIETLEPSLEVTVPEAISAIDLNDSPPPRQQGRYRGASIGSVSATTESSRISTPPGSSLRMSLINSDEESRSPTYGHHGIPDSKLMPPPPPPSSSDRNDGRARGKSVSSISSTASGLAFSYVQTSTPGTSLTPPSMLSLHGFPPVPEHEVAHHPVPQRKISSRAEARDLKKQNEEDILQIAQLPPSLDSSRSLAAQLAAYGDTHLLEAEFAEQERRRGGSVSGSAFSGGSGFGETDGEDRDSFFSAQSSRGPSSGGSELSKARSRNSRKSSAPSFRADGLLAVDAPKSSVPSINSIYDKRAAAYRDKLAALTSTPPAFPSSFSSNRPHLNPSSLSRRSRAVSNDSWLSAGPSQVQEGRSSLGSAAEEVERYPNISNPMPMPPTLASTPRSKKSPLPLGVIAAEGARAGSVARSVASKASASVSVPSRAVSSSSALGRITSNASQPPAPIAQVMSTRYAGMSPPPHAPPVPRLEAGSPYISIFSNRYAGAPHDGDDSDDDEQTGRSYTVIENDWRGGKVVSPGSAGVTAITGEEFGKKKGWGGLKGKIGHFRR